MTTIAAMVRPADLQTIRRDHRLDQNQGQVAAESLPRAGTDPGMGCFVVSTDKLRRPARLELSSSQLTYPPAPPKRGARHPVAGATDRMVGQFTGNVPLTITCNADPDAAAQEDDCMSTPGYGASAELFSHCARVVTVNRLLPKQIRQQAAIRGRSSAGVSSALLCCNSHPMRLVHYSYNWEQRMVVRCLPRGGLHQVG